MPRQVRESPPPAAAAGHTVFGRRWPLPFSPVVAGLVLLLAIAVGVAWFLEGRYETPPAEAARQLIPYRADQLQAVTLTTPAGTVTFTRDASGKLSTGAPTPTPSPVPSPGATPAPVQLAPDSKLEGLINQLHDLRIERVIAQEPSTSQEFGLDKPQLTLAMTPRGGPPATIAIGQLTPDQTSFYVRREGAGDTVLASKYTLEDLMDVAGQLVAGQ
ncbi:MAG TPA: DUF4340 domain-containing protein [Chloroflexota bacterium]|nr:DUF4340 domain-containing protein [Chloroflexota bacterium]